MSDDTRLIPGVCGVVRVRCTPRRPRRGGPLRHCDIFDAIARRAGKSVSELSQGLEDFRPGQTGLLRLTWDNGDRTVLVNPELGGVTFGWNLTHSAQDELFAAIEGTAFHTRVILERMEHHGVPIHRVINAGGIPQKNQVLNRVYANVLNKPVLIPQSDVTSLGSAIFAALAAGAFPTMRKRRKPLPKYRVIEPDAKAAKVYEELYGCIVSCILDSGKTIAPCCHWRILRACATSPLQPEETHGLKNLREEVASQS